ncbi:hypothetical protein SUGI_0742390 [Cryptomeria japonica]|nr:hypothetical protein SUGI_0742390 [Cryptomeria japonica]
MAVFLALQCYQCNTMQAKQQKKNNKWSCVICNEKQSVKRIFARSSVAKDIRKFVQDFNMSIHLHRTQAMAHSLMNCPQEEEENKIEETSIASGNKWSDYLEGEDQNTIASDNDNDDDDVPIVTALPDPIFGKRKRQVTPVIKTSSLSTSSDHNMPSVYDQCDNYGSAVANKKGAQSSSLPNRDQISSIIGRLNRSGSTTQKQGGSSHGTQDRGKQVSKWSSYMNGEAETQCDSMFSRFGYSENDDSSFQGILQTELLDQVVDEDVHPDFL